MQWHPAMGQKSPSRRNWIQVTEEETETKYCISEQINRAMQKSSVQAPKPQLLTIQPRKPCSIAPLKQCVLRGSVDLSTWVARSSWAGFARTVQSLRCGTRPWDCQHAHLQNKQSHRREDDSDHTASTCTHSVQTYVLKYAFPVRIDGNIFVSFSQTKYMYLSAVYARMLQKRFPAKYSWQ